MKTFVLSDGSVNSYGFRVLTSGIDVPAFKRNPIMLWMHTRGGDTNNSSDQVLPLGCWRNIRIEEDRLLAEPEFDSRDAFAMRIRDKVDAGIIRCASIGIGAYESTDSSALKLPGQTGITVTKCSLREASIVDVGANANAVTLYAPGSTMPMPEAAIRLFAAGTVQKSYNDVDPSIINDPAFLISYDVLHASVGLEELIARNYPLFCLKYYQHFRKMPKDCKLDARLQEKIQTQAKNSEVLELQALGYDALMTTGKAQQLMHVSPSAWAALKAERIDQIKGRLKSV